MSTLESDMLEIISRARSNPKPDAEELQRRADAERKLLEDSWWSAVAKGGVPRRVHALLRNPAETPAIIAAREYIGDPDARILILSGGRGCGKTFAASWIIAQKICVSDGGWFPTHYMPSGVGFMDISELARANRYDSKEMRPLETAKLLVIDDLGMEYSDEKGSFLATFDGLFNARYANDARTVITTNMPAKEFRKRYGERVADRIRECGKFVELSGKSLRGKNPAKKAGKE